MAKSKATTGAEFAASENAPSVIKPIIEVQGEPHPWQDMEKDDMLPIITSVGYCKVSPNSRMFVSYVIKSQGAKVISVEVSEPNRKLDCESDAKTSFVTILADVEEF